MDGIGEQSRKPWKEVSLVSAVGLLFLLMNFPKLLTSLVASAVQDPGWQSALLWPVVTTQESLSTLQGRDPHAVLSTLMSWNFLLLYGFLFSVLFSSMKRRDLGLLGFSAGGATLGYFALHLISWIALILIYALILVKWISSALVWILSFVFSWWFLWLPVVLLFVLWARLGWLRENWPKVLAACATILAIGLIAWKFFPAFWAWLVELLEPVLALIRAIRDFLAPIFHFLGQIFQWVAFTFLGIVLVIFVLNTLGRLVVDQIRAVWTAGRGRKELGLAGFALGSAFALIILTSVGAPQVSAGVDSGWNESLRTIDGVLQGTVASKVFGGLQPTRVFLGVMPGSVEGFVMEHFDNANPPLLDSLLLLVLLSIATLSVLYWAFSAMEERSSPPLQAYFLPREYLAIFGGLLVSVLVLFGQALSEGGDA